MWLLSDIKADIKAVFERDPAARNIFEVLLAYPGLHARECHRLAHTLWSWHVPILPRLISHASRFFTGVEIHPGVKIGRGLFIDHGMGVVIGETAEIGDNVTLYQGVTLGGTSTRRTKRHPTLGNNVVVGSGAKLLGAITVGDNVKIGSGSVVVTSVPSDATVVGVPGRIVTVTIERLPDPEMDAIDRLSRRIEELERRLEALEARLRDQAGVGIPPAEEKRT
jgi:serine O-acetyltransferase